MKGFYLRRSGYYVCLYSGTQIALNICYRLFVRHYPHLKLKPGEKIPVNIKITKRRK